MDEQCMHQDDEELQQQQQQQSPNNRKAPSRTRQNAPQSVQQYPPALAEAATQTCQSPQAQPVEHTPQVPTVSSGSSQRPSGEAASDPSSQGCVKVVHDMLMTSSNCGSNWSSDQEDIFHLLVHGRKHFEILKKIKENLELIRTLPTDVNVLRNLQQQRYVTELRGRPFNLSRHGSEFSQEVLNGSQGSSSAGKGSSSGIAQDVVTGETNGSNGPPRSPDGDNPRAWLGTLPDSGKPDNALYNFLKQIDCLEFLENFTSRGLSSVQQVMDVTLQDLDKLEVPEAKKRLLLSEIQEQHRVSTTISSESTLQRSPSEETVHLSSEDDDNDGIDTKDGIRAKVLPALRPSGSHLSSVGNRYRKSSIAKYNLRTHARQAIDLPRSRSWGGSSSLEVPRSKMPKLSSCSDIEEEEGLE